MRYTARTMSAELLRRLPQIEKILRWPEIEELAASRSRTEVADAVRDAVDALRREIVVACATSDEVPETLVERGEVLARVRLTLEARELSGYRRVINGTGIVLHTGLGRAVLAADARRAFDVGLGGYSLVEVDAASGERNERETALRELLCELSGAESATVVNNNAAATLLILAALARGREVVISRGQLVEIGGSFRVPDILAESGARLVEVGTTNRTYITDYERAITPETGLLLQVHTSNYAIRGFAHHTPLAELVALGRQRGVPVVSDLGSGCFVDLTPHGFEPEPLVADSVRDGADLVCFSGDKLLGGPQAGVIVGTQEAVARVRAHPIFRAVRVDKVALTLLEATLRLYRDPARLAERLPTLHLLSCPAADIERRVGSFIDRIGPRIGPLSLECVETSSQAGSGALPDQEIPSRALAVAHSELSAEELAARLRDSTPTVIGRIRDDRVLIDFRTVFESDEVDLEDVLTGLG